MISSSIQFLQQQLLEHSLRSFIVILFFLPLIYVVSNELVRQKARLPSFTGPAGLPIIGNIADIRVNAAEKYRQWAKKYGPVYQIQLGNIPVIVVNSAESARVIFGQHSQALSSRPVFYTVSAVSRVEEHCTN